MNERKMRFYNLRKEKRYSQNLLGKSVGVSSSTIGKYENGECIPSFPVAIKLASLLEITLEDLAIALELLPTEENKQEPQNS